MRPAWKKLQQSVRRSRRAQRPQSALDVAALDAEHTALLERIGLVDDSAAFAASKFADDDTDEDFYDRLAVGGGSDR